MGTYDPYKQQVVAGCRALVEKGFFSGTGGNLSLRVIGSEAFAVTPSNLDYLQMQLDDVCVLDFSLQPLEGRLKPSTESGLHAAVYQSRADVAVVVHTHQPFASAIALLGQPLPVLFDEQARFLGRSIEIVPYAPSGTGFLKNNVAKKVRSGNNAYIMQNHGVLCFGPSLERALFNVALLEKCALTYLLARCTEQKVTQLNPLIREIIVGKLHKDEQRMADLLASGEVPPSGQQSY